MVIKLFQLSFSICVLTRHDFFLLPIADCHSRSISQKASFDKKLPRVKTHRLKLPMQDRDQMFLSSNPQANIISWPKPTRPAVLSEAELALDEDTGQELARGIKRACTSFQDLFFEIHSIRNVLDEIRFTFWTAMPNHLLCSGKQRNQRHQHQWFSRDRS